MLANSPDPAPDIAAVEDLIRQKLSAAKAQELRIGPEDFGITGALGTIWRAVRGADRSICLIGVTLLGQERLYHAVDADFSTRMGCTVEQSIALRMGFDGMPSIQKIKAELSYFALGQKFRREVDAGLWR